MRIIDIENYAKGHTFNDTFHWLKNIENENRYVHVSGFSYKGIKCAIVTWPNLGVMMLYYKDDVFIHMRDLASYNKGYFISGDYLTYNAKNYIDSEGFKKILFNMEHGYPKNAKYHYKEFKKQNQTQAIHLTESHLRRLIKESIEKYLHCGSNGYTDFSLDKDPRYIWLKKPIR